MKNKRPEGYQSKEQYGIRIKKLNYEMDRKRELMLLDRETLEKTPKKELAKKFNLTVGQVKYAIKTNRVTSMANKSHPLAYLSEAKQLAVADHLRRIMRHTDTAFPVSMAKSMLQRVRKITSGDERQPSDKWFRYFLVRHNFESLLYGMKDKKKVHVDPETIKEWIEENEAYLSTVPPENLANMDETGFQIGAERSRYRLVNESVPVGKKVPGSYKGEPATAIECIVANGVALPPFIILKNLSESTVGKLVQDNVDPNANWGYGQTESGYACKRIMLDWLDHYDRHSAAIAVEGYPRVLLMDNFSAHRDEEVQIEAEKRGIKIIYLPANTTDNLQPLDAKIFGPLKQKYFSNICENNYYISVFGDFTRAVHREGWIRSYSRARESVLRDKNIRRAFEIPGIAAFNAEKIQSHYKKSAKESDLRENNGVQLELVKRLFELKDRCAKKFKTSYFKLLATYLENKIDEIDDEDEIREVIDAYFNESQSESQSESQPDSGSIDSSVESSPVSDVWDLGLETPPSTFTSAEASPSPSPSATDSTPYSTPHTPRHSRTFQQHFYPSPTVESRIRDRRIAIDLRDEAMNGQQDCDCQICNRQVNANRDAPPSVRCDFLEGQVHGLNQKVNDLYRLMLSFTNTYLHVDEYVDKCKQRYSLMEDTFDSITGATIQSKAANRRLKQSRAAAKSKGKVKSIPKRVVETRGRPPRRYLQEEGEDSDPGFEVIPQKRGPGRPRKTPITEDGEEPGPSTDAIPQKRGPGRPRKTPIPRDGEESGPSTDAIPQKRGPGRPRKRQFQEDGEKSDPGFEAIPQKRGPGRPRKKPCQGAEHESDRTVEVMPQKRGPGRPRKEESREDVHDDPPPDNEMNETFTNDSDSLGGDTWSKNLRTRRVCSTYLTPRPSNN